MKQLYSTLVWLLFFTLFLTSCRLLDRKSDPSAELEGEILIWHTWDGVQQAVLEELFDNFSELFPGVTIVGERFAPDNLQAAFKEQAVLGLGPDILIASADWAQDLHQQGLVKDIQSADLATDEFLANALGVLQNEDDLFGLPFTLNTFALYYNRSLLNPQRSQSESDAELAQLVQAQQAEITNTATLQTLDNLLTQFASERSEPLQPPANLEELLQQANAGHKVAMRSDFYGAFWGIQAFGGQLFDAENRVILNQGGFANWLSWLKRAGDNPNVILNRRSRTSTDLFINGDVTYYVGLTTDFPILQEALGAENVGVARLPGRQNKPAGPLLEVEAIMFSRAATDTSYAISLRLAQYLTSNEQQKELALLAGKLPTNNQVRIDPRVSPVMAEFIAQGRTAVPIRLENRTIMSDILKLGNDFYALVLDGEIGVVEAANSLTQQVNDTFGLETLVASALDACDVTGTVALWHSWSGKKEEALIATRDAFIKGCPEANILLVKLEQTELFDRLSSDGESRKPPALILGVNQWIIDLASQGIIRDIDAQIDPDFLQRYAPVVERAARFNTRVYGIPVNLDVAALYYNTRMVEDPPAVLDDVLTFATPDTPFAMPLGF
ncbi:MAG TPA: extracellular solute-binding protein, partial [Anaerolineae bacterium]|nr:extracellular solute-binding protein [Anaerolineae bacterium]